MFLEKLIDDCEEKELDSVTLSIKELESIQKSENESSQIGWDFADKWMCVAAKYAPKLTAKQMQEMLRDCKSDVTSAIAEFREKFLSTKRAGKRTRLLENIKKYNAYYRKCCLLEKYKER